MNLKEYIQQSAEKESAKRDVQYRDPVVSGEARKAFTAGAELIINLWAREFSDLIDCTEDTKRLSREKKKNFGLIP